LHIVGIIKTVRDLPTAKNIELFVKDTADHKLSFFVAYQRQIDLHAS